MTSRSKQKIKFECTLAFDRQHVTSVILHFLVVPRLCSNIAGNLVLTTGLKTLISHRKG